MVLGGFVLAAAVLGLFYFLIDRILLQMPKDQMNWPVRCPLCDHLAPMFRIPENRRRWFEGGWTCCGCGADLDNKGNVEHFSATQAHHVRELSTKFFPTSPLRLKKRQGADRSIQEMPTECEEGKGSPHG
jgi:hypothetical protein